MTWTDPTKGRVVETVPRKRGSTVSRYSNRRRVHCCAFAVASAEDHFNLVIDGAFTGWDVRCSICPEAGVKGDIGTKSCSSYMVQVDPHKGRIRFIDSVREVELLSAKVNAIGVRGELDGNPRVAFCSSMKGFEVLSAMAPYDPVESIALVVRYGPNVDIVLAVVGDNGFGLSQGREGTKQKSGTAEHGSCSRTGNRSR